MRRTPLKAALAAGLAAAMLVPGPAGAADTTVRVLESGDGGWVINPDPANETDYEFTDDQASIGAGSLKGGPIGTNPAEKLIAGLALGIPVPDLESISYDFLIAGTGTAADASDFYLNVYATVDANPAVFYDCRFDYVPTSGSTAAFTTATFAASGPPTAVTRRGTRIGACPATLAGMPAGSHVRAIALNIGDTSASDTGLAGYLDNVRIATGSGTTTYDFDVNPGTKDDCKSGGWALYGFANQGGCVSWVQANPHAGK
jgi:hypothetical protein